MTLAIQFQFVVAALCCCSLLKVVELRPTPAEEWNTYYSEVFGSSDKNLTEQAILERMMLLHTNIGDVGASDLKTDIVEQVHNLLTDVNTQHCNAKHMDDARKQLRKIKDPFNGNLMTIFSLVHDNMVEVCQGRHMNIDAIMRKQFDDDTLLYLVGFQIRYEDWYQGKISGKELRRLLIDIMLIDHHATKEQIIAKWDQSACGKLLKFMNNPEMQSFQDFVKLVLYLGLKKGLNLCPRDITNQVRTVNACTKLDGMIRDMSDTRPSKRDKVTRFLKTCGVGSAC